MKPFVLQQQLPPFQTAIARAEASLEQNAAQGERKKCSCPHLSEYLPDELCLDVVQAPKRGWILSTPLHAVHLASQLDPAWFRAQTETEPILFGDEQERALAMTTAGLAEQYHAYLRDEDEAEPPVAPTVTAAVSTEPQAPAPPVTTSLSATQPPGPSHSVAPSSNMPPPTVVVSSLTAAAATTSGPKSKIEATAAATPNTAGAKQVVVAIPTRIVTGASSVVPSTTVKKAEDSATTGHLSNKKGAAATAAGAAPKESTKDEGTTAPLSSAATATVKPPSSTVDLPKNQPPSVVSFSTKNKEQQVPAPSVVPSLSAVASSAGATGASTLAVTKPGASTTSQVTFSSQQPAVASAPPPTASAAPETKSATVAPQQQPQPQQPQTTVPPPLSEYRYRQLDHREEQIQTLRRTWLCKRAAAPKRSKSTTGGASGSKKRKDSRPSLYQMPAWKSQPVVALSVQEEEEWEQGMRQAGHIELWMELFRSSRRSYWEEQKREQQATLSVSSMTPFGAIQEEVKSTTRSCALCKEAGTNGHNNNAVWLCRPSSESNGAECQGDDLMQCLECSCIGCAPQSVVSGGASTYQHSLQHWLQSNHKLAVTCGPKAKVYCFQCCEFVSHEIFDQEKERLDLVEKLPWQAWKEHPVQRSFDALQFVRIGDPAEILWKGMAASYPALVPQEHLEAARMCRNRQILFQEPAARALLTETSQASEAFLSAHQSTAPSDRWKIRVPVGMYNLGNTCFQNAILQCLIHCRPLQKYFLHDVGHHHLSCPVYREMEATAAKMALAKEKSSSTGASAEVASAEAALKKAAEVCLACEVDKLFLRYEGSTIGVDVLSAVVDSSKCGLVRTSVAQDENATRDGAVARGTPLITAEMLTAAWKCGEMSHLAGYEQRDAHEFLHGFLDNLGRHTQEYHDRVYKAINTAQPGNAWIAQDESTQNDAVKKLFEGKLRSVLMCQLCGNKRIQSESFMSISLPLSKEVQGLSAGGPKLSVEWCLKHFTIPETLTDPVDCPTCGKKTPTKKQHVVSKLPKVLCLHLKRFDAAHNRKIEDFVSFPACLNMAPFLPHWCEVASAKTSQDNDTERFTPNILYNLFGTVNHFGNLQSGHYVANVKVDGKWFHCNDAEIYNAGPGNGEAKVLTSDGAYLLFYVR